MGHASSHAVITSSQYMVTTVHQNAPNIPAAARTASCNKLCHRQKVIINTRARMFRHELPPTKRLQMHHNPYV